MSDPGEFVATLVTLLDEAGRTRYDGAVSQIEHALQAAALARAEGASDALVAAALLHDVGHLLLHEHDAAPGFLHDDRHHEAVGARFLRRWFSDAVVMPVALHVRAKRYLVAVEPSYAAGLSESSRRSLAVQGGPMTPAEAAAFRALAHADGATAVRRWDDRAKVAGLAVPSLTTFASLLRAQVTPRRAGVDPRAIVAASRARARVPPRRG